MGYRKCDLCGAHNYNVNITIFDVSRRIFTGNKKFTFLCENHFDPEDIVIYSDGKKRYVMQGQLYKLLLYMAKVVFPSCFMHFFLENIRPCII